MSFVLEIGLEAHLRESTALRSAMLQAAIRVGARVGTRRSAPGAMARTTRDRLMFRSFASYPDHTEVTMPALSPVRKTLRWRCGGSEQRTGTSARLRGTPRRRRGGIGAKCDSVGFCLWGGVCVRAWGGGKQMWYLVVDIE